MIFLTIGTQLPFDRLIQAMDEWALNHPEVELFAQIGNTDFKPQHMEAKNYISPTEFELYTNKASVIVSHAGMGTIISSLLMKKPIIVMARDSDLGEHRNQHQQATCKRLKDLEGFYSCNDKEGLFAILQQNDRLQAGIANNKNQQLAADINKKLQSLFH